MRHRFDLPHTSDALIEQRLASSLCEAHHWSTPAATKCQDPRHWARIACMHPLIENNLEPLTELCRRHGVRRLEAFGSILRKDFDPGRSDVDILVEFDPSVAASFTNFLNLKEALETLFGRSVDLVELSAIRNRRLRRYIEQSKSPIYDAA